MYQRDVAAENKETLERLVMALDELTRVVSKDDTSRTILDVLKEKGAKDVKEIPASDGQAEEIKTRYRSGGGGGQAGGTRGAEFQDWNLTTLARLNQAFRALQGDLGAFQRTLVNAAHWGNQALNAGRVAESVASTVTEAAKPKPVYRKATDEEIEAAMKDAASKGMSGMEMLKVAEKLAKQGIEVTPEAGSVADRVSKGIKETADKIATPTAKEESTQEPEKKDINDKIADGIRKVAKTLGVSTQTLANVAKAVSIISIPSVMGRLATGLSNWTIQETGQRFGRYSPEIASVSAQYEMSKVLRDMRIAPQISESAKDLITSKQGLDRTLEPIEILGKNLWNRSVTLLNDFTSAILTPVSWVAEKINQATMNVPTLKEIEKIVNAGDLDAFAKIPFIKDIDPEIMDRFPKAWKDAVVGAIVRSTNVGVFASEIKAAKLTPAMAFVP